MPLSPGTNLGSYEIVSLLGAGGMGEVYKAKDLKLGRDVAIKVLREDVAADPERLRRFEQEARAASSLNHPNIVHIYDIGEQDATRYIAMEYVEGKTLREMLGGEPLPTKKLLKLSTQIAEGLAKAHTVGIIHRDLKPENLMVTSDGLVKILDFGLAKLMPDRSEVDSEMVTKTKETREGIVLGTVQYMSPEQAAGRPVDYHSDQFSFGSILYEMATGKLAYQRDTGPETQAAIMRDEPEPISVVNPQVPAQLIQIIGRCLEKEPAQRYDSTRDLARELEGFEKLGSAPQAAVPTSKRLPVAGVVGVGLVAILAAIIAAWFTGDVQEWIAGDSSSPNIESIAVLPLDNLSGDPEQEYFADGMTEALTAALAKIGALKVISRTSAVRYKGSDKPLPEIARELGVDAIIEGSAMRVGDRVRITAQLIEAATDEHLWADSYERDLMNVLALQSDVARAVAQQIQIELTSQEEERLASAGPVDPEAHEAYLRGRVYESKVTAEGYQKAIALYEQALDRDPNHALAYAGIAESYLGLGVNIDALPDSEAMPLAREAAMKALEIDPTLAEAHALLGRISMLYDWNWAEAERQLAHALDLNPSSFSARRAYSRYLSVMGRGNEAIAEERRAQEIGPLEVGHMSMGLTYYLAREYDRALEELQRLLAKGGRARGAYLFLSLTYEQKEMWDEKIAADQKVLALSGFSPEEVAALGQAYAVSGVQGSWEWWLEFAKEKGFFGHSRVRLARAYMLTGDIDQTFRLLERGYEERDNDMLWLKVTPWFDPIRDDPRFQDLLRRMNFPES